ncbi:hypothetical protein BN1708_018273, partial [Verticillium longisporum]
GRLRQPAQDQGHPQRHEVGHARRRGRLDRPRRRAPRRGGRQRRLPVRLRGQAARLPHLGRAQGGPQLPPLLPHAPRPLRRPRLLRPRGLPLQGPRALDPEARQPRPR